MGWGFWAASRPTASRRARRGGSEFTALLEGSAEDRRGAAARAATGDRARHRAGDVCALAASAPAPADAQLADPERMAAYMEALGAHASRQEALQSHEAEVRENRWISEQLEQLERGRQRDARRPRQRASGGIAARASGGDRGGDRGTEISAPEIAAAEISAAEIAAAEIAARGGVDVVAPPALALAGGGIQLALARGGTGGGGRAADMTAKLAPSPGCRSRDPTPRALAPAPALALDLTLTLTRPCRSPLAPLNRSRGSNPNPNP